MSIFTLHRFTTQQLQQAHERLRMQCPLTRSSGNINMAGDDPQFNPLDPANRYMPRAKRDNEKRHYRLKNH